MRAADVRAGDTLIHDGRALTVTAVSQAFYREEGERVEGVAIACRAAGESARWVLYRRLTDLLHRVIAGMS